MLLAQEYAPDLSQYDLGQLGKSVGRGIAQIGSGFFDLAGMVGNAVTQKDYRKPMEDVFGTTEYLTKRGVIPEPQLGLLNTGTEIAASLLNPAAIGKAGLLAGAGILKQTGQKLAGYSDDAAELFKQQYKIPKEKQLQSQELPTEFNQAFDSYMDGRITQPEYIDAMNKFYPASIINKVPELTPQDHLVYGLGKKAKEGENIIGIGSTFDDGDRVLSRLDIPAYNNYNVWSASIKQDGGETVYGQVAHLTSKDGPVTFKVNPNDALKIAKGKSRGGTNKFPMATIDGNWKNTKPEDVKALAEKYLNDPNWSQVGMNPKRAGYFYDKADMMPVSEADEVLQIGPLVLAKNAKKFDPSKSVTTEVNPVTGSLLSF